MADPLVGLRAGSSNPLAGFSFDENGATPESVRGLSGNTFGQGLGAGFAGWTASKIAADAAVAEASGDYGRAELLKRQALAIQQEQEASAPRINGLRDIRSLGDIPDYISAKTAEGLGSFVMPIAAGTAGRALLGPVAGAAAAAGQFYEPGMGGQVMRQWNDPRLMETTTADQRLGMARAKGVADSMWGVAGVNNATKSLAGQSVAPVTTSVRGALAEMGKNSLKSMGHMGVVSTGMERTGQIAHSMLNPQRDNTEDLHDLVEAGVGGAVGMGLPGAAGGGIHAAKLMAVKGVNAAGDLAGRALDKGKELGGAAVDATKQAVKDATIPDEIQRLHGEDRLRKNAGAGLAERFQEFGKDVGVQAADKAQNIIEGEHPTVDATITKAKELYQAGKDVLLGDTDMDQTATLAKSPAERAQGVDMELLRKQMRVGARMTEQWYNAFPEQVQKEIGPVDFNSMDSQAKIAAARQAHIKKGDNLAAVRDAILEVTKYKEDNGTYNKQTTSFAKEVRSNLVDGHGIPESVAESIAKQAARAASGKGADARGRIELEFRALEESGYLRPEEVKAAHSEVIDRIMSMAAPEDHQAIRASHPDSWLKTKVSETLGKYGFDRETAKELTGYLNVLIDQGGDRPASRKMQNLIHDLAGDDAAPLMRELKNVIGAHLADPARAQKMMDKMAGRGIQSRAALTNVLYQHQNKAADPNAKTEPLEGPVAKRDPAWQKARNQTNVLVNSYLDAQKMERHSATPERNQIQAEIDKAVAKGDHDKASDLRLQLLDAEVTAETQSQKNGMQAWIDGLKASYGEKWGKIAELVQQHVSDIRGVNEDKITHGTRTPTEIEDLDSPGAKSKPYERDADPEQIKATTTAENVTGVQGETEGGKSTRFFGSSTNGSGKYQDFPGAPQRGRAMSQTLANVRGAHTEGARVSRVSVQEWAETRAAEKGGDVKALYEGAAHELLKEDAQRLKDIREEKKAADSDTLDKLLREEQEIKDRDRELITNPTEFFENNHAFGYAKVADATHEILPVDQKMLDKFLTAKTEAGDGAMSMTLADGSAVRINVPGMLKEFMRRASEQHTVGVNHEEMPLQERVRAAFLSMVTSLVDSNLLHKDDPFNLSDMNNLSKMLLIPSGKGKSLSFPGDMKLYEVPHENVVVRVSDVVANKPREVTMDAMKTTAADPKPVLSGTKFRLNEGALSQSNDTLSRSAEKGEAVAAITKDGKEFTINMRELVRRTAYALGLDGDAVLREGVSNALAGELVRRGLAVYEKEGYTVKSLHKDSPIGRAILWFGSEDSYSLRQNKEQERLANNPARANEQQGRKGNARLNEERPLPQEEGKDPSERPNTTVGMVVGKGKYEGSLSLLADEVVSAREYLAGREEALRRKIADVEAMHSKTDPDVRETAKHRVLELKEQVAKAAERVEWAEGLVGDASRTSPEAGSYTEPLKHSRFEMENIRLKNAAKDEGVDSLGEKHGTEATAFDKAAEGLLPEGKPTEAPERTWADSASNIMNAGRGPSNPLSRAKATVGSTGWEANKPDATNTPRQKTTPVIPKKETPKVSVDRVTTPEPAQAKGEPLNPKVLDGLRAAKVLGEYAPIAEQLRRDIEAGKYDRESVLAELGDTKGENFLRNALTPKDVGRTDPLKSLVDDLFDKPHMETPTGETTKDVLSLSPKEFLDKGTFKDLSTAEKADYVASYEAKNPGEKVQGLLDRIHDITGNEGAVEALANMAGVKWEKTPFNKQGATGNEYGSLGLEGVHKDNLRRFGEAVQAFHAEFANGASGSATKETLSDGTIKRLINLSRFANRPLEVNAHEGWEHVTEMLGELGPQGKVILDTIERAVSTPIMRRWLEGKLMERGEAPGSEAMKQLDSASERAAYAFQFFAAKEPMPLPSEGKAWYAKIYGWIKSKLGFTDDLAKTQNFFKYFDEGDLIKDLKNPEAVVRGLGETRTDAFGKELDRVTKPLRNALHEAVASTGARIEEMNIPEFTQILEIYRGERKEGGYLGLYYDQRAKGEEMGHKWNEVTHGMDAADKKGLLAAINSGDVTSLKNSKLKALFTEIEQFKKDHGMTGYDLANPMIRGLYARDKIGERRAEFEADIKAYGGVKNLTPYEVTKIADDIIRNGHYSGGDVLFRDNAAKMAKWLTDDPDMAFASYAVRSVNAALNHKHLGPRDMTNTKSRGSKVDALIAKGSEKATPEQKMLMEKALLAFEGKLGNDIGETQRQIQGALIAFNNIRLLPFGVFSQTLDPLQLAFRKNELSGTMDAFWRGMRGLVPKGQQEDFYSEMSKRLGTAFSGVMTSSLNATLSGMEIRGRAGKLNDLFFRYNGMDNWNTAMHEAATQNAEGFILRHSGNSSLPTTEHSTRFMGELGLKASDIKVDANGHIVENERVRTAVIRFVNDSMAHPDPFSIPLWMSDPHFALIAHLKRFTFAHTTFVLARAGDQLKNKNSGALLPLALAVPWMMTADQIKEWVTPGNSQYRENMGMSERLADGVSRAGLFGPGQFGVDAVKEINHGGPGYTGLLGPVAEFASRAGEAIHKNVFSPLWADTGRVNMTE